MKDITIIIPVHKLETDGDKTLLESAVKSVNEAKAKYTNGNLKPVIVCPDELKENVVFDGVEVMVNDTDKYDFCTQINFAVDKIEDEYFSILEYDDTYRDNWFKNVYEYAQVDDSVSVFMPMVATINVINNACYFLNESVWAATFSEQLGLIDDNALKNYKQFSLTGAVFNKQDFIFAGKFKSSLGVAFAYEFLMRLVHLHLKAYVIPKLGYVHTFGREGSLSKIYMDTLSDSEIPRWFELADRECMYHDDRNKPIIKVADDLK